MRPPAADDLHELEVQKVLRWLDLQFAALSGADGLDALTRQLREKAAKQALEGLPFEPVSHALGRWLNGEDPDKRACALGLITALGLKEHVPALRTLRHEAEPGPWSAQLDAALRKLAPRHRDD